MRIKIRIRQIRRIHQIRRICRIRVRIRQIRVLKIAHFICILRINSLIFFYVWIQPFSDKILDILKHTPLPLLLQAQFQIYNQIA